MSFVRVHCYLLTGGILHGKGIHTEIMQVNSLQLQGYNQDGCPKSHYISVPLLQKQIVSICYYRIYPTLYPHPNPYKHNYGMPT